MNRTFNLIPSTIALVLACSAQLPAATVFVGGDIFTAANWNNGFPAVGNDGTISTGGTFTSSQVAPSSPFNFSQAGSGTVTVNHTAGALTTGGGFNDFYPNNTAGSPVTFAWNQSGGSVTTRLLVPGNGFQYTLSGGAIINKNTGGDRIYLFSGTTGTFAQTGGTLTGIAIDAENGSTLSLSGGTATNTGVNFNQPITGAGSSIISISGNHTITFNSTVTNANLIVLGGTSQVAFDQAWTGSWTHASFTAADWTTALTDTGVKVGGTQVTAGNFSSLFNVLNAGTANSSITVVPEPSSLVLLALAAIGLACTRRRWMRA